MTVIAVAKGRIEKQFLDILKNKNMIPLDLFNDRQLTIKIADEYNLILVKSTDVLSLVSNGYADVGVVGSDVINEDEDTSIKEVYDFNDGKCYFALCGLPTVDIKNINSIASKYVNTAYKDAKQLGIDCTIKQLQGSLEVAPLIGYADAIIDIVETGNTLKENGLVVLQRLESISTRMICKTETENVRRLVRKIC